MSTRPADVLRGLDRPEACASDRDLAHRYASHGDQVAFAELVRRHGPMVWSVCLRVAGNRADAEDAFQAVFLVLIRRLAAISNLDLLGNWLYGVAVRVALKARRSAARRRKREVQVPTMPDPPCPAREFPTDLDPVIDEELAKLSAHYRDAIVLCDLREVPRAEAARLLGIPEGTLSSRLANGRKQLAARLARRGVALSAAAIPATLANAARASVPIELIATVQQLATGAAAPAAVARLASGDHSVKTSLFFGLVLGTALAGAVYAGTPADPPQPQDPPKPPAVAKADPAREQKPAVEKGEEKVAFTTKPVLRSGQDISLTNVGVAVWSRDGSRLALQGKDEGLPNPNPNAKVPISENAKRSATAIYLVQLKGTAIEKTGRVLARLAQSGSLLGFSPNGAELITDQREYGLISGHHQLQYFAIEAREFAGVSPFIANKREFVELEATDTHGYHFAPDGKTFRTVASDRDGSGAATKLRVIEVDAATGKPLKTLIAVDYGQHELSPNGKRLAVFTREGSGAVYDVDAAKKLCDFKLPESPIRQNAPNPRGKGGAPPREEYHPTLHRCFSPDGRLLIVARDIGVTVVLNTDTGRAMPPLEGPELMLLYPGRNAFTGDGRLVVSSGGRFVARKATTFATGVEQTSISREGDFLTVWDTQTGKALKSWDRSAGATFNPVRPLLAILEPNEAETRVGLWDFAAEVEKK